MSRWKRSTPKSGANAGGFTSLELLISMGIIGVTLAATSGMFLASRNFMRDQSLQLEATQAARATVDMLLRELRLGGACLPVTGTFISLDGTDNGTLDEIVTRTGLTRPDLSCVRTASAADVAQGSSAIPVGNADGFTTDMRAYVRHPNGTGEFNYVSSIDLATNTITMRSGLSNDYPATSGVYAIDERRFHINTGVNPPVLELVIDEGAPWKLAVGIEALNLRYELNRNCPACDLVDMPVDDSEWAIVDQLYLTVTARSPQPAQDGTYYRRSLTVAVKPRNLLPRN